MALKVEFREHPARARHPLKKNQLLLDDKGNTVPLIKDMKSVYIDDTMIGYIRADGTRFSATVRLEEPVLEIIQKRIVEEFNTEPRLMNMPPLSPPEPAAEEGSGFFSDGEIQHEQDQPE